MASAKSVGNVKRVDEAKLLEHVQVILPNARPGEEKQVFAAVNGRRFLVPRGRQVSLPRYVAEMLQGVLAQEQKYEREVAQTYLED